MVAVPDPTKGSSASDPAVWGKTIPRLLDLIGMATVAGGALAAVLLLVDSPFQGPWRVVLAVAVVFVGIYAGFLMIGFAANLRALDGLRRCLARGGTPTRQGDGT
ncbi:hypothetical protein [Azospirillum sp. SYSU D00513]|uniref:hypothetical protein n=1 Tax=Azospirillum sp. SYSU D00513 TaxID=2812561 RepID=UPI001A958F6A|nr:hypothetical protein [Azospirillum sp. SYSU D00513]